MKITNKLGLPQSIVDAVSRDDYSKGKADYSVTDLLTPPQVLSLRKIHANELTEDASELIWRLMGTAIHYVIDSQENTPGLSEHRLFAERGGKKLSGQIDHYDTETGMLTDYKVTSAWAVLRQGVKPEWERQLNYYRYLCNANHIFADKLQIIAILRDWSATEAQRNEDYPQRSVVVLPVKVHDWRTVAHQIDIAITDHGLDPVRECTQEERWFRPGKIALMKSGNKRAAKLFDDWDEMEDWIRNSDQTLLDWQGGKPVLLNAKYYIEERPGSYPRCERYCNVAEYCDQWKKETK